MGKRFIFPSRPRRGGQGRKLIWERGKSNYLDKERKNQSHHLEKKKEGE